MSYLDGRIDNDDHYFNKRLGCRLPHDDIVADADKLAELSGPVVTYNLRDVTGVARYDVTFKEGIK